MQLASTPDQTHVSYPYNRHWAGEAVTKTFSKDTESLGLQFLLGGPSPIGIIQNIHYSRGTSVSSLAARTAFDEPVSVFCLCTSGMEPTVTL